MAQLKEPKSAEKNNSKPIEGVKHSHNCTVGIPASAFDFEARKLAQEVEQQILDNTEEVISASEPFQIAEVKGVPQKRGSSHYDLLAWATINNYQIQLENLTTSEDLNTQGIVVVTKSRFKDFESIEDEDANKKDAKKFIKALKANRDLENYYRKKSKKKGKLQMPNEVKKVFVLEFEQTPDPDSFGGHYYSSTQQIPNISYKNTLFKAFLRPIDIDAKLLEQVNKMLQPTKVRKIVKIIRGKVKRTKKD